MTVRHESAFAPNAPNPLKNFHFAYDYTEAGNASLLSKRHGPLMDVVNSSGGFMRAYTSTHSYLPGRNELHKLENALNVGRVTNSSSTPMTRAYGAWTASSHDYAVNHLGQRTLHQQDLKRYGNWNSNLYDRRADRTYGYNDRGELATATSTYPNGFAPDAFLYQPVSETESYTYDAIGNRKTATIPKRAVVPTNQANLAGEFGFGVLPSGTGESVTYGEASNANTYTTVTKTNTNNPSNTGGTLTVTQKHDADGNLLDDGEFLYKYDPENRLIAVDPKVLQSGYGEAGFRYAYDHLHRRIRRQVVWWCGAWPLPTQEISHFVYRGWNLALHIHQDYMCYNDTVGTVVGLDMGNYANGLSSRRTDRYVWGRDVSGSLQGAGGVGGLLMCVANPKHRVLWVTDGMLPSMAYYFLYDGNGNVSEVVHERGAVLGQYRYDGFGKLMGQNATHYVTTDANGIDQIYSGINQPFKFSTKWHDDTNHNSASYGPYHRSRTLVYSGGRTYVPELGRSLGKASFAASGALLPPSVLGPLAGIKTASALRDLLLLYGVSELLVDELIDEERKKGGWPGIKEWDIPDFVPPPEVEAPPTPQAQPQPQPQAPPRPPVVDVGEPPTTPDRGGDEQRAPKGSPRRPPGPVGVDVPKDKKEGCKKSDPICKRRATTAEEAVAGFNSWENGWTPDLSKLKKIREGPYKNDPSAKEVVFKTDFSKGSPAEDVFQDALIKAHCQRCCDKSAGVLAPGYRRWECHLPHPNLYGTHDPPGSGKITWAPGWRSKTKQD